MSPPANPFRSRRAPVLAAAIIGLASVLPLVAHAAPTASVAAGREIALNVCSACHRVAAKQDIDPILQQPVPSFQDIADNPATTAQSLRHDITTTHWDEKTFPMKMPNPMLLPEQADQVSRYILSLRKTR